MFLTNDTPFGFRRRLRSLIRRFGCVAAYLDIGTNIGVQVRKLFEPHRYKGSLFVHIFHQVYGGVRTA